MPTKTEAPATEPLSLEETGLALRGVSRRYPPRRRRDPAVSALEDVDLEVRAGEVVAVVGPSGCGKSTLLELVAGLQEPDEGTVVAAGAPVARGRRQACAYMPQRDLLLPWRSALSNAGLALECQGVRPAEARGRAATLL
jgi:ABC-type nitrate/sulfonate/bicarbonate transport system ATPase subunit